VPSTVHPAVPSGNPLFSSKFTAWTGIADDIKAQHPMNRSRERMEHNMATHCSQVFRTVVAKKTALAKKLPPPRTCLL
jgi:hypothetical protein